MKEVRVDELPRLRVLDVRLGSEESPIVAAIEIDRGEAGLEQMIVTLGVKEIRLERDRGWHGCVLTFPFGFRKISEAIESELKRF